MKPNPALTKKNLIKWPHLQNLTVPELNGEVMLLIGVNTPKAFWVIDERRGNVGNLYAVRTTLGWSLVGPKSEYNDGKSSSFCENVGVNFVTSSKAELLEQQIECLWRLDNVSSIFRPDVPLSKEDRYALHIMKNSKALVDGHYQLALPWKPGEPRLKDNRQ